MTAVIQGTNLWSGVAGGSVNGAVVGGTIDITLATGGSAAVLIGASFVAGGVGGYAGDFVNQVGNNLANGKGMSSANTATGVVYNAAQNTITYLINGQFVTKIQLSELNLEALTNTNSSKSVGGRGAF